MLVPTPENTAGNRPSNLGYLFHEMGTQVCKDGSQFFWYGYPDLKTDLLTRFNQKCPKPELYIEYWLMFNSVLMRKMGN